MNKATNLILTLFLATALTISFSPLALAEQNATQKMAQIVSQLNHWPSANDKDLLRDISEKGNKAEKTIANALLMMNHQVSSEHKEKLTMIIEDLTVPENTRVLAKIVRNLKHQVSPKEREILLNM